MESAAARAEQATVTAEVEHTRRDPAWRAATPAEDAQAATDLCIEQAQRYLLRLRQFLDDPARRTRIIDTGWAPDVAPTLP
jgi:hypothetical protein